MTEKNRTYEYYSAAFRNENLPLLFLDIDLLDENIKAVVSRSGGKKIRLATKSIRSRYVLEYILKSNKIFQGLMCYTAAEAAWLASEGFDDILLGYPQMNRKDWDQVALLVKAGKTIIAMVDHPDQIDLLNEIGEIHAVKMKICLDIDMSTDFPGLHFGVYRSPLKNVGDVKTLLEHMKKSAYVELTGVMGYEAQTAGIGDNVEGAGIKNTIVKVLKSRSNKDYTQRRKEIVEWLNREGYDLTVINAGGTGSMESSSTEPWVTEITVGSGFYSPGLFDHYSDFKFLPALGFVLPIVRIPKNGYFTCLGGGYIASGETGVLKQPYPYLPAGVKPLKHEGFGEVQTPFEYEGKIHFKIGDPVIFRHAKAGELCEHFNYISVVKNGSITQQVTTYRGDGKSFL